MSSVRIALVFSIEENFISFHFIFWLNTFYDQKIVARNISSSYFDWRIFSKPKNTSKTVYTRTLWNHRRLCDSKKIKISMWWFTQAYRWLYIYEGEKKKEYKHIIETVKPLAENFQEAVCQPKPLNECFYANDEIILGLVVTCVASIFGLT